MDLVTVIVPIYNMEEYLDACLESILNQTYRPIQVILIDDGSTDRSLSICEKYAKDHPFIEVYHQENQGVSVARNTGLTHTKGKWVFFVDSDDIIAPEFISHFMEMGDYPFIGGGYTENTDKRWQFKVEYCVVSAEEYKRNIRQYFDKIPTVHAAGNRYLYSIIADNQITFDRGISCGEDLRFNVKYLAHVDQLCASPHCDYFYTMRSGSAIHSFWPERLQEERTECQAREALFAATEEFNYVKYIHWHTTLEHLYRFAVSKGPEAKIASKKLREAALDPYFRKAIPWLLSNGTKDMWIEAFCLKFGSYRLYRTLIKIIGKITALLR